MPLQRAVGSPLPATDAFYFPMRDILTGDFVICQVSYNYLSREAGYPVAGNNAAAVFHLLRDQIETLASARYDAGERPPNVTIPPP
jgi:hypothetical protein